MHKSGITFGVLLTSLVMLAIMPILNNSIVAMVQAYDKYGNSCYSQYPIDQNILFFIAIFVDYNNKVVNESFV